MRLLALDIGAKRIGIALSESGILATPHSVLRRTSKAADFDHIQQLIDTLAIERVIVGMPYSLGGHELMGPQALRIQRYAAALADAISVPIDYVDERYSTVTAESYLSATGQKKVPIDAAAAAVILQTYLDAQ